MRAVVVGVGDELLSGLVVNTNAAMIGELLLAAGIRVVRSVCVGDDEDAIVEVLRDAGVLAEVVIVTGGLGPTQDDLTREAFARLLGTELVRDETVVADLRERFARFGRDMPPSNLKQADVPGGATAISNPWGTAPGVRAEVPNAVLYAIPGVPSEARRMLTERIIPELSGDGTVIRTRELRCVGLPESELADRLGVLAAAQNPRMAYLPGGGEVRLRFVATGTTEDDCAGLLDASEAAVREICGTAVCGTEPLEILVGRMLADGGLTVATAESCTAGMLAARIANVPGSSGWLRGGVVAYQNDVKMSELGVPASLIDVHGPVSSEVAGAMARGARDVLGADFGLSVTCAAGPDPHGGVDVGTTVLAVADAADTVVRELRLPGDRDQVRAFATTFGLNLLRLRLLGEF